MTLVTVIGLDRFVFPYKPNGIQCDDCGTQVNFDRKDYRRAVAGLRAEGWVIDARTGAVSCGCDR